MEWISQLAPSDWLIVAATLSGPVLAVQAQKWLERLRERDARRKWVFATLMATRGGRTAPDHVRALNSIDLTFYVGRIPSSGDKKVRDAWREYHKHLHQPPTGDLPSVDQQAAWNAKSDELFVNLLEQLCRATGFKMSREEIRTGNYSPQVYGQVETEQIVMRRLAIGVLAGDRPLSVSLTDLPAMAQQPAPEPPKAAGGDKDA